MYTKYVTAFPGVYRFIYTETSYVRFSTHACIRQHYFNFCDNVPHEINISGKGLCTVCTLQIPFLTIQTGNRRQTT